MFLKSELFEQHEITHGFGMKDDDVKGIRSAARDDVLNRCHPERSEGSPEHRVLIPSTNQLHGTDMICLDDIDTKKLYEADAFYTTKPNTICFVRTADCLPLLIADTKRRVVAAVHAGWRGACGRIASKVIERFYELGSSAADIICVIGPHIRQECFEVGTDVLDKFKENSWPVEELFHEHGKKYRLNLERAVAYDLAQAGIKTNQLDILKLCTFCDAEKFHSFRREGGEVRQYNFIIG